MPSLSGQEHRGLLGLRYPMEHGVVRDWNDMERIWQYVYSKDQLQTFSEEVRQPESLRAGSHISCTVRPSHLFTVCVRGPSGQGQLSGTFQRAGSLQE